MKKRIIFGICSVICSIFLITPSFIKVNANPYGTDAVSMIPFDTMAFENLSDGYNESFPLSPYYVTGTYSPSGLNFIGENADAWTTPYDATNIDGVFEDFPFLYGRVLFSAGFSASVPIEYVYLSASGFFLDYDVNYFGQYFKFYGLPSANTSVDVTAIISLGDFSYSYDWADVYNESIDLADLFALVPIARGEVYYVDYFLLSVTLDTPVTYFSFDADLLTVTEDNYNTFVFDYLDSLPQKIETVYTINIFDSLLMSIDAFFTTELIPGISIMVILGICLAVPLVIMILKMWLGG